MPGSSPGMTRNYGSQPHSFRRTHLDRAGAGAAVTRGVVHVLDIGLRQHVFAGRDRAHDVSHREHRRVVGGAIDRSRKAVVAELGIFRLLAVPIQSSVPESPEDTSLGLSISSPAGR